MSWGVVSRPQSPQVQVITTLFAGLLILAAVILLVMAGLVIYGVVRILISIGYLFSACIACSLLVLTFSPPDAYPAYLSPRDQLAIQPLIRSWGIDARSDQQLGGMLMWPGCLVYLSAILARVARWYNTDERVVDNMA